MRSFLAAVAAFFIASNAHASTTTLSIVINSPPSTSVTCTQSPPSGGWVAPLAAGTVICPIVVAPSTWSGALALSGTSSGSFALSGSNLVVGSSALAAGTYSLTVTATP